MHKLEIDTPVAFILGRSEVMLTLFRRECVPFPSIRPITQDEVRFGEEE